MKILYIFLNIVLLLPLYGGWQLIDDFEVQKLGKYSGYGLSSIEAGFPHTDYSNDPVRPENTVFWTTAIRSSNVVTASWNLDRVGRVQCGAVATIYFRFLPIRLTKAEVVSAGLFTWNSWIYPYHIGAEVGIGEGAALYHSNKSAWTTTLIAEGLIDYSFENGYWYEIWIVVDRDQEKLECYVGKMPTVEVEIQSSVDFTEEDPCIHTPGQSFNFLHWSFVRNYSDGGSQAAHFTAPLYIDDIYIDVNGRNLTTPSGVQVPDRIWSGYHVFNNYVNAANWIGWLYVLPETDWVYTFALEKWIYFPEPAVSEGGWAWFLK